MGWDEVGWDGMGWDGMGWDGMGWDGMGWDGVGWEWGWDGDREKNGETKYVPLDKVAPVLFTELQLPLDLQWWCVKLNDYIEVVLLSMLTPRRCVKLNKWC
jgi:hypothetical protein